MGRPGRIGGGSKGGNSPWSQGEHSEPEKGRQGAKRPLEGVFPSKLGATPLYFIRNMFLTNN
jgi:hypothetical protein